MTEQALRFVIGGAFVTGLPVFARHFGTTAAALVLAFPTPLFLGLLLLGRPQTIAVVAITVLMLLPANAVFLLVVHVAARQRFALAVVLLCGAVAWLAVVVTILALQGG